ncbi:MarR family transcriptional regulator [Rhodovulum sulfidophilum]|uniref:MarR family transcriptional regulator n=1 Tax=Rhodovulum sulfidophilum TaxID=35806 RepID=A0A0D6B0Y6_RHOSU|nr:MarR family transcriptional regulator [Rhodovulum sulfidophilum]ANB35475.1 MarR family transcriptional regulator [Rhodovulum sulfidophilum DSM 1374]ANB39295.1 MarR family transcriptional regulator [Rhodovulum sulfidophilum]MBK5922938.1 MarR family transcriptional regulator [Rhodovulum sulfidophilum]MBL3553892.1 MarR family transcriptional regulator [Rhodovulum sulfidophilum]MBL3561673.1 MarR family transcriptional regulator [Rhodovulum sulfidophilum]
MKRSELSLVALRRILRATELYGRELARAAGLTAVQIRVLQIVAETGQSTPKTIATRMGVSQATMTTLIDRLVAKGLVDRRRSEADRRQMIIAITALGRESIDRAPDPLHDRYVIAFEKLPDWEQAMLVAALERVAALLDAGNLDAAPVLDLGDIRKTLPE